MPIHRLPPLVVNQIAAGEVVERPASAVKELVENAIDALADRVDVAIEKGGRDLIRVTDNGAGICFEELSLAVAPHATSKIADAADLESIGTLGFRGEALASIAAVSRLSVISRPAGADEAGRIEVEGDRVRGPRPESGPPGTTVTVHNLFFNTPARRKFLRAEATETGRVTQVLEALALGHEHIGFSLSVNGRRTLAVPAEQGQRRRVLAILGRELEAELLPVSFDDAGISITGLAGRPGIARGTARHQHVFLNGRPISERGISHAIKEAYRGLLDPARYPTIALFIRMDAGHVDVNVHPAKAEVRFRSPQTVHDAVLAAIRNCLRAADLAPPVEFRGPAGPRPAFGSGVPHAQDQPRPRPRPGPGPAGLAGTPSAEAGFVYGQVKAALEAAGPAESPREVLPSIRPVQDVLQVHSSYLVVQDEQGLLIIDQHALHERVMFETLMEAVGKGNLESQRLLMPAMVERDQAQMELLEGLQPLLSKIGIEAEPAGPNTIAVHAFCSFLFERGVEPAEFLGDLLDRAANEGMNNDPEAALHETLDMMACKAAVKAGDRLSRREIESLLAAREAVERSSRCPHGRPTTLRLTLRDLERQFGRR